MRRILSGLVPARPCNVQYAERVDNNVGTAGTTSGIWEPHNRDRKQANLRVPIESRSFPIFLVHQTILAGVTSPQDFAN
jgi:hypothetical protein